MSDVSFEGRVALVTGAGSAKYDNLGRAYALELAKRGAKVAVNDISRGCERVATEIIEAGGQAVPVHASIGTPESAASVVDATIAAFGRIDIVINNAGNLRRGPFEDLAPEDFEVVMDVHLRGSLYVAHRAYKQMLTQKYGRIVNICSSAAVFGMRNMAPYGVAKMGLLGLTNAIAVEGQEHGILCNAVLPFASVDRTVGKSIIDDASIERAKRFGDLAGHSTPDFVVPLVTYLASERCTTTHGAYSANHGRYARVFIGITPGWISWAATPPTAEELVAHFSEVEDQRGYGVPLAIHEETELLLARVSERRG